jgi:hypothetical protein
MILSFSCYSKKYCSWIGAFTRCAFVEEGVVEKEQERGKQEELYVNGAGY